MYWAGNAFIQPMRVHKHAVQCKCYHSAVVSIKRIQYLYVILYLCGKYRFLQSGYTVNTIATLQAEPSRYGNCNKNIFIKSPYVYTK